MLGNEALKSELAGMAEKVGTNLALLEVAEEDAIDWSRQQSGKVGFPHAERQTAEVLAITGEHVKGVQADLVVMAPAVQSFEVRNTIRAQNDRFAIEHKRSAAETAGGIDNQWIPLGPVVSIPGEQAGSFALSLEDQKAVVFNLMNPIWARRYFSAARRDTRFKRKTTHAV
jgi:hypothetical protein